MAAIDQLWADGQDGLIFANLVDFDMLYGHRRDLAGYTRALVEFDANGAIAWAPGLVMVGGAIIGGYYGAFLARRVSTGVVRAIVIVIAWTMTAYFFVK